MQLQHRMRGLVQSAGRRDLLSIAVRQKAPDMPRLLAPTIGRRKRWAPAGELAAGRGAGAKIRYAMPPTAKMPPPTRLMAPIVRRVSAALSAASTSRASWLSGEHGEHVA